MTVISLDKIVKNILLKRRYPWHYYLEFLIYAKDILREIAFDTDIIPSRYKLLPVENFTVQLPDDFVDYVSVSVRVDQYIHPLAEDVALQTVPNFDSNFQVQPYVQGVATEPNGNGLSGYYSGYTWPFSYWYTYNWNSWGENTGRQFGGIGTYIDTFKIDRSKNIIKINEGLSGVSELLLTYISNGMDADSATHIDSYAQQPIESGSLWQFKEHNRTYSAGEAERQRQIYLTDVKILRARKSSITIDNLKRLIQKNQRGIQY